MKAYQQLARHILEFGELKDNRTGNPTIDTFGGTLRFDLRKGFPILTTRKMNFNSIVAELLWFIRGSSNVDELREIQHGKNSTKRTIWDDNYEHQAQELGYSNGELGPIYGKQWRKEFLIDSVKEDGTPCTIKTDQLKYAIQQIKESHNSRRILVNCWQVEDLRAMALPPCHYGFQFNVSADGEFLDLLWIQRSNDFSLGTPYNITSYATLLSLVAKITGKTPRFLIGQFGSLHIYQDHVESMKELIGRTPYELPKLVISSHINTLEDIEKALVSDFSLVDYQYHEPIKMKMTV